MTKPTRTFNPFQVLSVVLSGLKRDIDNIMAMFDPAKTLSDGSAGGISAENLNDDVATTDYAETVVAVTQDNLEAHAGLITGVHGLPEDFEFVRATLAYDQAGNLVATDAPRYEDAATGFGKAVYIEQGTANIFTAAKSQSFASAWTSDVLDGIYTVSVRGGTGKLVLSGGASGEVAVGGSLSVAVSTATVTFTPADGTPERSQLEAKSYATSWHLGAATRNAEVLTVPSSGVLSNSQGSVQCRIKRLRA